jgi:hypothetical protein
MVSFYGFHFIIGGPETHGYGTQFREKESLLELPLLLYLECLNRLGISMADLQAWDSLFKLIFIPSLIIHPS